LSVCAQRETRGNSLAYPVHGLGVGGGFFLSSPSVPSMLPCTSRVRSERSARHWSDHCTDGYNMVGFYLQTILMIFCLRCA